LHDRDLAPASTVRRIVFEMMIAATSTSTPTTTRPSRAKTSPTRSALVTASCA
jgi:hypothetical protein